MKSLALLFLSLLPLTASQTLAGNASLIDTLRSSGLNVYATFLETSAPSTLAVLSNRSALVVFAPSDSAPIPVGPSSNVTLSRRDPDQEAQVQAQINDDRQPPPFPPLDPNATAPDPGPMIERRGLQKRQAAPSPDSGFQLRRMFLVDPKYIHLGLNVYLSLVTNLVTPAEGDPFIQVRTGMGNVVVANSTAIPFDKGVIYTTDKWFTLPQPLSNTLAATNCTSLAESIAAAGLTERVDNTPGITVFCPLNGLPAGKSPLSHISKTLVYSPSFVADTTYGEVKITTDGTAWYANGGKIVKSDIPIKNGVVHYYENTDGTVPYTGEGVVTRGNMMMGALAAAGAAVWGLL